MPKRRRERRERKKDKTVKRPASSFEIDSPEPPAKRRLQSYEFSYPLSEKELKSLRNTFLTETALESLRNVLSSVEPGQKINKKHRVKGFLYALVLTSSILNDSKTSLSEKRWWSKQLQQYFKQYNATQDELREVFEIFLRVFPELSYLGDELVDSSEIPAESIPHSSSALIDPLVNLQDVDKMPAISEKFWKTPLGVYLKNSQTGPGYLDLLDSESKADMKRMVSRNDVGFSSTQAVAFISLLNKKAMHDKNGWYFASVNYQVIPPLDRNIKKIGLWVINDVGVLGRKAMDYLEDGQEAIYANAGILSALGDESMREHAISEINAFLPDHYPTHIQDLITKYESERTQHPDLHEPSHSVFYLIDRTTKEIGVYDSAGWIENPSDAEVFLKLPMLHTTSIGTTRTLENLVRIGIDIRHRTEEMGEKYKYLIHKQVGVMQSVKPYDGDCSGFACWFAYFCCMHPTITAKASIPIIPGGRPTAWRNYMVACVQQNSLLNLGSFLKEFSDQDMPVSDPHKIEFDTFTPNVIFYYQRGPHKGELRNLRDFNTVLRRLSEYDTMRVRMMYRALTKNKFKTPDDKPFYYAYEDYDSDLLAPDMNESDVEGGKMVRNLNNLLTLWLKQLILNKNSKKKKKE